MAEKLSQSATSLDKLLKDLPEHDLRVELAALFYLRWADFQESEQEAIAAFDDIDYKPVLPSFLHWRSWHALQPEELQVLFSEKLPHALDHLNNSRHNAMATNLHRIAHAVKNLGQLSPRSLETLIRWLADQPFETANDRRELLGTFDSVFENRRDKKYGELRTPSAIAELMIELAKPVPSERIYDPSFGSAELLIAANDYVVRQGKEAVSRGGAPLISIAGIERNPNAFTVGLTRLALAGIDNPQLELGNSLERMPLDNPQRDGFDVVVCNPPWEMRSNLVGLDHYPVRTTDSTGLFIQHALSHLRPDGRAVILAPQGFLFRSGPEQRLRRMLLEQHTLEAIVSLPSSVLMPYTSISSSLLLLKRGGHTLHIRMVDSTPFFEKAKGGQSIAIRPDLAKELIARTFAPEPLNHCWDVDAESVAKLDWDLSPRRRDQSGLNIILDSLRTNLEVSPLKDCCQISVGRFFKREQRIDFKEYTSILLQQISEPADPKDFSPDNKEIRLPSDPNAAVRAVEQAPILRAPIVRYIQIQDLGKFVMDKGDRAYWRVSKVTHLSLEASAAIKAEWKLRAGDVLLSRVGTIGKTDIVRNGAVGAIASDHLFMVRPDQKMLDPHFLLAFFQSAECKAWLEDKSTGTTIRHISKKIIDELPVPLPSLQIQQRVAAEHRDHDVDALSFLSQLLTGGIKENIAEWIDKISETIPANVDSISDPLDLSSLDRAATEIQAIRNEAAHGRHEDSPLVGWLLKFSEAISGLRRIQSMPRGPGLLSVLQESARNVTDSTRAIRGYSPNESRARSLTKLIADWLDRGCSALLDDVSIVFSSEVGSLPAGQTAEFSIRICNQGALPLRDLRVNTTPDWGHREFGFLPENEEVLINLRGIAPKSAGSFSLTVAWLGSKLDGQYVNGLREIPINVIEPKASGLESGFDIGGSPYICGDPVRPERNDVFFGRDDLIERIRRQIIKSGNVVLLEGNRRSGKSSILCHLEGSKAIPGWMGIYCSLQGAEGSASGAGVPTVEIFRAMARSIAASLQSLGDETPLPDGTMLPAGKKLGISKSCFNGISEGSAFSDFRDYVEVALDRLSQHNLGLLLMLDEFDKIQEGIESGVTSPQVPENIRFLVQTYPRFSTILTGLLRLRRLREEYWSALFGLGTRFGVSSLSQEAARRLVIEPVKGRLAYSREAVELAIELTAGHPFLLQCLCNRFFDMAAQLKMRSVTVDMVDRAADEMIDNNEHFAAAWDDIGSDRRRFLLALCQRESGSPDPFSFGVIREKLNTYGIELGEDSLIADLESLRELEMINLAGEVSDGHYILKIPLMGKWIERQHDFNILKSRAKSEMEDLHG